MTMKTWLEAMDDECLADDVVQRCLITGKIEATKKQDPTGRKPNEPGAKLDAGKQYAGVLLDFAHALSAVADVGTMGANKYSRGGWKSVPNGPQRYLDAALRHLLKHGQGETRDPESGLTHLAHATWNLLAIAELQERAQ